MAPPSLHLFCRAHSFEECPHQTFVWHARHIQPHGIVKEIDCSLGVTECRIDLRVVNVIIAVEVCRLSDNREDERMHEVATANSCDLYAVFLAPEIIGQVEYRREVPMWMIPISGIVQCELKSHNVIHNSLQFLSPVVVDLLRHEKHG